MREVIVDTGVVVAWLLLDEEVHDAAVAFRERIVHGELEPVVAGHFDFELRSAPMQAARRERMAWDEMPAPRLGSRSARDVAAPVVHG